MYETKPYFYGTGRRKDSVARVRVYTGTGKITINDRDIDNYFGLETLKLIVRSPLVLLGLEGKYDVVVRVSGGGVSGQAGAILTLRVSSELWSSPRPISTRLLNGSLHLHIVPINLVVFKGSYLFETMGYLIFGSASRLDAFSVYPIRT